MICCTQKALEAGVDIICAQGGEGGGHTSDVATSVLIPKVRLILDLYSVHRQAFRFCLVAQSNAHS